MDARSNPVILTVEGLDALIGRLRDRGWTVMGPTVRDGVVTHAEITSVADLPAGTGDEQAPGRYRLRPRDDGALFGYTVPAVSWKGLLFPPRELILARGEGPGDPTGPDSADPTGPDPAPPPYALFGVRSCDLHALRMHDRVLLGRQAVDVRYERRRAGAFVVAVSCTEPGGTCFCAGLGTGPAPADGDDGYDVRLTELSGADGHGHRFVAVAGTAGGDDVLRGLPTTPAGADDLAAEQDAVRAATGAIGRRLDTAGLREALYAAAEHPHWTDVAARCLACANCTLVCPTCFCTSVEDAGDLTGSRTARHRVWDSCFTADFSYLHGGSVRESVAARYRQWVTHKLAAWQDQFGGIGCVGCGRCTTWCPAGIDLLAEVAAVRAPWIPPTGGGEV